MSRELVVAAAREEGRDEAGHGQGTRATERPRLDGKEDLRMRSSSRFVDREGGREAT